MAATASRHDGRRGTAYDDRYSRQTILPEVGAARAGAPCARPACSSIGAGGLGCPVLQYLCAAGVGRLLIVDHDRVEESNLHRQPLYRMSDIGRAEGRSRPRPHSRRLNPQVRIEAVCERLTPPMRPAWWLRPTSSSMQPTVSRSPTSSATNVSASGKPLISASVLGLSGYVGAFCGGAPSYRAVFPEMPRQAGSCATAGVLGTAVGVMGTLQAQMVLSFFSASTPSSANS